MFFRGVATSGISNGGEQKFRKRGGGNVRPREIIEEEPKEWLCPKPTRGSYREGEIRD